MTLQTETVAPKTIRPFWGRVSVLPSPVEETQLSTPSPPSCGVVLEVDGDWADPDRKAAAEQIPTGTVIYYRGGTKIHDVVVLAMDEIIAYEVP